MQYIDKIKNFIFFNYQKPTKYSCIKRILAIWIVYGIFNHICKLPGWHLGVLFGSFLFISISLLLLRYKYKDKIWAQFLGDGIFYYGIAVFMNYVAYTMMCFQNEYSIILFFVLLTLLHISIVLVFFMIRRNIRNNRYASASTPQNLRGISATFGFLGIVTARILFSAVGSEVGYFLVEYSLIILSYCIGSGSFFIYKAYLCYHYLNKQ